MWSCRLWLAVFLVLCSSGLSAPALWARAGSPPRARKLSVGPWSTALPQAILRPRPKRRCRWPNCSPRSHAMRRRWRSTPRAPKPARRPRTCQVGCCPGGRGGLSFLPRAVHPRELALKRALKAYQSLGDSAGEAGAYQQLSTLFLVQQRYPDALRQLDLADQAARAANSPLWEAGAAFGREKCSRRRRICRGLWPPTSAPLSSTAWPAIWTAR